MKTDITKQEWDKLTPLEQWELYLFLLDCIKDLESEKQ